MNNALGLVEAIGRAAAMVAVDTILKAANVTLIGIEPSKGGGMYAIKIEGDVGAVKAAVDSIKSLDELKNKVFSTKVIPRPSAGIEKLIYNSVTIGYEKKVEDAILEVIEEETKQAQEFNEANTEAAKEEPIQEPEAIEEASTIEPEVVSEDATITIEEPAQESVDTVVDKAIQESIVDEIIPEPVEKTSEPEESIEILQESEEAATKELEQEQIELEKIAEVDTKKKTENQLEKSSKASTKKTTKGKTLETSEAKKVKKEICNLCNDPKCSRRRGEPKNLCIHYNTKST